MFHKQWNQMINVQLLITHVLRCETITFKLIFLGPMELPVLERVDFGGLDGKKIYMPP